MRTGDLVDTTKKETIYDTKLIERLHDLTNQPKNKTAAKSKQKRGAGNGKNWKAEKRN